MIFRCDIFNALCCVCFLRPSWDMFVKLIGAGVDAITVDGCLHDKWCKIFASSRDGGCLHVTLVSSKGPFSTTILAPPHPPPSPHFIPSPKTSLSLWAVKFGGASQFIWRISGI